MEKILINEIFWIIIKWAIPFAMGFLTRFIINETKKNSKKEKAIKNGVQALLRNELIRRYREYKAKGEISILDKENIEHMFTEYKNLGGNGTVKELMDDLLEVPTKVIKF